MIEILLTPEHFGNFSDRALSLRVGHGYMEDFPPGNEGSVLYTFEGPVDENTTLSVEQEYAWVHLLTRQKEIYPFKVFYDVKRKPGVSLGLLPCVSHFSSLPPPVSPNMSKQ